MSGTEKKLFQKKWAVCIGAVACCILWGSAFPCIKTGYRLFEIAAGDSSSQILFAGLRFFLAGVLVILFGSAQEKKVLVPRRSALPKIALLALFQTILQYVFFYVGLAHTTAVKGSIISGSSAFFAILIASVLFRDESMHPVKAIGCILGFAGLVIVNLNGESLTWSVNLLGDVLMLISSVSSGMSSSLIRMFTKDEDPVLLSGYQFMLGGSVMAVIGALTNGRLRSVSGGGLLLLLYMALISSVAYTLWGVLIKYNSVSRIAVFNFLTPVMGVLLSALILTEAQQIGLNCFLALALVCAGIYLVNRG